MVRPLAGARGYTFSETALAKQRRFLTGEITGRRPAPQLIAA
jgi:hypothetical protein